ncbi:phenylalanine-4-hydroxylase [Arachidicoccus rhizosphaerae]|uniref:Phenylalanine-4-hydroxylase n=1 Tax=Arachidicoccus rhizosphaerae TaxID=551991 RepID=A0A1H4C9E7_9BACT|nr:aromatic amino acid hydroxylase [Arachidicoccus rhizosphaerae]SEA56929.1 phenylalanine-4-hydroxylase [Arachidicoccus rhizosphaerae]
MLFNDFNNPQVAGLPPHLRQYIVSQHYERYTPIDHAVWRYVMRQNYSYLKKVAYYPYIKGLERAGLSIEHIPDLQTMNDNLSAIGWGAVAVDGFIPPAIFMEFQEYKVLVIAAEIRQLEHIAYTPTPDIIHESAGHAPIIADPDYNNYLSYFGAIGAKALFSAKDYELYDAIRALSILKELPGTAPQKIAEAELHLDACFKNLGAPSEMALLSRLHWWSVEYGLIGTLEDPKIYGAGLLSSIGESVSCMKPEVEKRWYTLQAADQAYDITKAQPQLFVTPTFQNLIDVLEAFADTMAFRVGGLPSLNKAIESKNIATAVYSSGLQVSGIFSEAWHDDTDRSAPQHLPASTDKASHTPQPVFIRLTGPVSLSFQENELAGHDRSHHPDGFSSPVGRLKNLQSGLENADALTLKKMGVFPGNKTSLSFESGIEVSGEVVGITTKEGKNLLIHFKNCTVTDRLHHKIIFEPSWGNYDLAIGEKIISVFNGHADKKNYPLNVTAPSEEPKIQYDEKTKAKQNCYGQIRAIRNNLSERADEATNASIAQSTGIWVELRDNHPEDWLGPLEILELMTHHEVLGEQAKEIRTYLEQKLATEPGLTKLIEDGLRLIDATDISLYVHPTGQSMH